MDSIATDPQGLWVSRRTPGQPWAEARQIARGSSWPTVAIDARGNALVAWLERPDPAGGPQVMSIKAVSSQAGAAWGEAHMVAHGDWPLAEISPPSVAFDAHGDAFVAWSEAWEKAVSVWVRRFSFPGR